MANPPAGWHPDPLARHAQRYWDGQQWTEHVADESGNMSTDPLDAGQGGQQAQDQGGWGQQDTTPSWGQGETTSDTTSGTASGEPASAWGDPGAGATGGTGDWGSGAAGGAAGATAAGTTDAAVPAADTGGLPTVDNGLATIDIGAPVVVRHGSVVARAEGVTTSASAHPGCVDLAGSGTVHVGAGGRSVAVLEVPAAGLTVRNDALLAHTGDLDRAGATDGIVGYDATTLSGTGWVAVAAPGGLAEVSPVGGVHVTTSGLVAWSSDLDVSHADDVHLVGGGIVLVSAESA